MSSLTNLADQLGAWANLLPPKFRKALYKGTKVAAGLATLFLLVYPLLPQFGLQLTNGDRWLALATGFLTFVAHVADRNTHTEPLVDLTTAPEPGNPVPPLWPSPSSASADTLTFIPHSPPETVDPAPAGPSDPPPVA